jgi:hypothetical protein
LIVVLPDGRQDLCEFLRRQKYRQAHKCSGRPRRAQPQMLNLYTITSTFTEFFTFLAPFLNKSCTKQHTYGVGAAATGNRAHFRHFENTHVRPHARLLAHSAGVSCIM